MLRPKTRRKIRMMMLKTSSIKRILKKIKRILMKNLQRKKRRRTLPLLKRMNRPIRRRKRLKRKLRRVPLIKRRRRLPKRLNHEDYGATNEFACGVFKI
jgi:hypothetical protein